MHLLLYDMGAYIQEDLMEALDSKKISYKNILYKLADVEKDLFFEKKVIAILRKEKFDAVMSVNYWPILASICKNENMKYIVWSYDSPIERANIYKTLGYNTNYIFLFDRMEYEEYHRKGFNNIYHLPLAVNTKRLDRIPKNEHMEIKYGADISMVGEIYQSPLQELMEFLTDYETGYFSAVVQAQLKVNGYSIIKNLINDGIIDKINNRWEKLINKGFIKSGIQIMVAKEVTHIERLLLMEVLAEEFSVNLFSSWTEPELERVNWRGTASYLEEMPSVFKNSKINLNATIRCIESGIPLRALDILGCGGFLLSNYQQELADYFIDGEEVVFYHNLEDAVMKCRYYLQHDKERLEIAKRGYDKVKNLFSYDERLNTILHTVFGTEFNFS